MAQQHYLDKVRTLIGENKILEAIKQLKPLLENSPQLNTLIIQAGRHKDIMDRIHKNVVNFENAEVEKNKIRAGLLYLLDEIKEAQQSNTEINNEIESAVSIINGKNVTAYSTITNSHVGDTTEIHNHNYGSKQIAKFLTKTPSAPNVFIGREDELEQLRAKLSNNNEAPLLLVNGNGGIGKTTLAAKYFNEYKQDYNHLAWVFADNGIFNALLSLSAAMNVDFPPKSTIDEQIDLLLQVMANLEGPNLLVIDNANDISDLKATYFELKRCKNFHLLLTSRINNFKEANYHRLPPLDKEAATRLFKKHYYSSSLSEDEHALLEQILEAVGRNTLVTEILAKSLQEKNELEVEYTLHNLYEDLTSKGLFHVDVKAKVQTNWTKNLNLNLEKPEDVLAALYDLDNLDVAEQQVLANLTALPAVFIPYSLLKQVITDQENLKEIILHLYKKGWLEFNEREKKIKISPVVQETCKYKNPHLFEDCKPLIDNLLFKLEYEGSIGHFVNTSNYEETQIFIEWSEHVLTTFDQIDYNLNVLAERIGAFYQTTGNLIKSEDYYKQSSSIVAECCQLEPNNVNFKNGLAISYSKLGSTHTALGNINQALEFFQKDVDLTKELFDAYPNNVNFKNGLAISYSKLGETHTALGNINQALEFFQKDVDLTKELFDAYPNNVNFKNGLAISYSKLGETHTALGNINQALEFFQKETILFKELFDAYPNNVNFKNGLAISYEKLGETHTALGNINQALEFFQKRSNIGKELFDAYPNNVNFKNGLAISYSKLGETHTALGNINQALEFFQKETILFKELFDAYPNNVNFKNGLAISYEKLGETHTALGNINQALEFFQKETILFKELFDAYPNNVNFKNGLAISYSKLGETHTALGNINQALEFFQKETILFKELFDAYPNNVNFKNGLAISYSKLGETHTALGNINQALEFFQKETILFKELFDAYPNNVNFKNGLAIAYSQLGRFYINQKEDPITAKKYFLQCEQLWKELAESYPSYAEFQNNYDWVKNVLKALE